MIADDFTVESIDWSMQRERDACRAVHEEASGVEQKVLRKDEEEDLDASSHHVLARDLTGRPIGTGRLTPPQHGELPRIGRLAVLEAWRGRHVDEGLMLALMNRARALGYSALEIHAQSQAIPFYTRFGFATYGEEFFESSSAHIRMRCELAQAARPELRKAAASGHTSIDAIDSRDQAVVQTLALIGAARRDICIYTRDLDPALLDSEAALEALKRLAISGRGASIRVLVLDAQAALHRSPRVVALAQRMSSVFAMRVPSEEDRHYSSAFVLNDTGGYYFRTLGSRYEGEAARYAPGRRAQLQEYFNTVWERAEASEELRSLSL